MKIAGDYLFEAGVQDVWDALFDPEVLAAAMPGCEKLEVVDGDFVGEMTIKVGPISGKFSGRVHVEDRREPQGYKMVVDGKGGPGFVKATANLALAAEGEGTRLTYQADAQIGGKIASVGERLLDASAKAITKQSLDGLHENVKIRAAAKKAAMTAPEAPAPTPAYKQADAGEMAKTVAKAAAKAMLPAIIVVVVVVALVVWLVVR
jgi:carbon monoxide dehydrogenase subunit G